MRTNSKCIIKTIAIVVLSIFLLFSCSNILDGDILSSNPNSQGALQNVDETYIVVDVSTSDNIARNASNASGSALSPSQDDINDDMSTKLTNFVLKGRKTSETTDKTLATVNTLTALQNRKITLQPGSWNFSLTAKFDGVDFSGTLSNKNIKVGETNRLNFKLTSDIEYGGLSFTVGFTGSANAVVVTLYDAAQQNLVDSKTLAGTDLVATTTGHSATYTRSVTDEDERLDGGTYYLAFKFYNASSAEISANNFSSLAPLNISEHYVQITDGFTTKATINISLNESYSITYNDNGGELASGQTKPLNYSRKSNITLPTMVKTGYIFGGWYTTSTFDENTNVTSISTGSTGAKSFYAKWLAPILFVSASGNDSADGFSVDAPLKTIGKACDKIVEIGSAEVDWTIKISGNVTGAATSSSDTYGWSIIPNTITSAKAKSILLTGASGLNDDGIPLNAINRGKGNYSNPVTNGNVLVINTAVPVTITNLMITGGQATLGSGIKISEGATVKLGNGALIIGNNGRSNSRGGAIYNEGTLFMYGSAVIGDKDATDYSSQSSTATVPSIGNDGALSKTGAVEANFAMKGGGIYNGSDDETSTVVGRLYLGYSGFAADGETPQAETLTGGIYFNGASEGGAIYNGKNSVVYYNSGNIKWNCASSSGGAIYNYDGATFRMTGGNILNNRSYQGGGYTSYAGAVYNNTTSTFIMGGGTMNKNRSASATSFGGAVYNKGKFFMYGTAVIGNAEATLAATTTSSLTDGNTAQLGAGIYNDEAGSVYLGYKPGANGTPEAETLTGGIYYNYASATSSSANGGGGGAICNKCGTSGGIFKIASGNIKYNTASNEGGAIWHRQNNYSSPEISGGTISGNNATHGGAFYTQVVNYTPTKTSLIISGNLSIPAGTNAGENDIYLGVSSTATATAGYTTITVGGTLGTDFAAKIVPENYVQNIKPIRVAEDSGTTFAAVKNKFSIVDQVMSNSTIREWYLNNDGDLKMQLSGLIINISFTAVSTSGDINVTHNVSDGIVVFTAPATGYSSYTWKLDGTQITSNDEDDDAYTNGTGSTDGNVLTVKLTSFVDGVHEIYLIAQDAGGDYYSWTGQYIMEN